jgi:hypothetical protein
MTKLNVGDQVTGVAGVFHPDASDTGEVIALMRAQKSVRVRLDSTDESVWVPAASVEVLR